MEKYVILSYDPSECPAEDIVETMDMLQKYFPNAIAIPKYFTLEEVDKKSLIVMLNLLSEEIKRIVNG